MGREIVCQESKNPGERTRVWHHMESFDILHDKIVRKIVTCLLNILFSQFVNVFLIVLIFYFLKGTINIEGSILDMNMLENSNKVLETKAFERMRKLIKTTKAQLP